MLSMFKDKKGFSVLFSQDTGRVVTSVPVLRERAALLREAGEAGCFSGGTALSARTNLEVDEEVRGKSNPYLRHSQSPRTREDAATRSSTSSAAHSPSQGSTAPRYQRCQRCWRIFAVACDTPCSAYTCRCCDYPVCHYCRQWVVAARNAPMRRLSTVAGTAACSPIAATTANIATAIADGTLSAGHREATVAAHSRCHLAEKSSEVGELTATSTQVCPKAIAPSLWLCCSCTPPMTLMRLFESTRYGAALVMRVIAYCDTRSTRIMKSFFHDAADKMEQRLSLRDDTSALPRVHSVTLSTSAEDQRTTSSAHSQHALHDATHQNSSKHGSNSHATSTNHAESSWAPDYPSTAKVAAVHTMCSLECASDVQVTNVLSRVPSTHATMCGGAISTNASVTPISPPSPLPVQRALDYQCDPCVPACVRTCDKENMPREGCAGRSRSSVVQGKNRASIVSHADDATTHRGTKTSVTHNNSGASQDGKVKKESNYFLHGMVRCECATVPHTHTHEHASTDLQTTTDSHVLREQQYIGRDYNDDNSTNYNKNSLLCGSTGLLYSPHSLLHCHQPGKDSNDEDLLLSPPAMLYHADAAVATDGVLKMLFDPSNHDCSIDTAITESHAGDNTAGECEDKCANGGDDANEDENVTAAMHGGHDTDNSHSDDTVATSSLTGLPEAVNSVTQHEFAAAMLLHRTTSSLSRSSEVVLSSVHSLSHIQRATSQPRDYSHEEQQVEREMSCFHSEYANQQQQQEEQQHCHRHQDSQEPRCEHVRSHSCCADKAVYVASSHPRQTPRVTNVTTTHTPGTTSSSSDSSRGNQNASKSIAAEADLCTDDMNAVSVDAGRDTIDTNDEYERGCATLLARKSDATRDTLGQISTHSELHVSASSSREVFSSSSSSLPTLGYGYELHHLSSAPGANVTAIITAAPAMRQEKYRHARQRSNTTIARTTTTTTTTTTAHDAASNAHVVDGEGHATQAQHAFRTDSQSCALAAASPPLTASGCGIDGTQSNLARRACDELAGVYEMSQDVCSPLYSPDPVTRKSDKELECGSADEGRVLDVTCTAQQVTRAVINTTALDITSAAAPHVEAKPVTTWNKDTATMHDVLQQAENARNNGAPPMIGHDAQQQQQNTTTMPTLPARANAHACSPLSSCSTLSSGVRTVSSAARSESPAPRFPSFTEFLHQQQATVTHPGRRDGVAGVVLESDVANRAYAADDHHGRHNRASTRVHRNTIPLNVVHPQQLYEPPPPQASMGGLVTVSPESVEGRAEFGRSCRLEGRCSYLGKDSSSAHLASSTTQQGKQSSRHERSRARTLTRVPLHLDMHNGIDCTSRLSSDANTQRKNRLASSHFARHNLQAPRTMRGDDSFVHFSARTIRPTITEQQTSEPSTRRRRSTATAAAANRARSGSATAVTRTITRRRRSNRLHSNARNSTNNNTANVGSDAVAHPNAGRLTLHRRQHDDLGHTSLPMERCSITANNTDHHNCSTHSVPARVATVCTDTTPALAVARNEVCADAMSAATATAAVAADLTASTAATVPLLPASRACISQIPDVVVGGHLSHGAPQRRLSRRYHRSDDSQGETTAPMSISTTPRTTTQLSQTARLSQHLPPPQSHHPPQQQQEQPVTATKSPSVGLSAGAVLILFSSTSSSKQPRPTRPSNNSPYRRQLSSVAPAKSVASLSCERASRSGKLAEHSITDQHDSKHSKDDMIYSRTIDNIASGNNDLGSSSSNNIDSTSVPDLRSHMHTSDGRQTACRKSDEHVTSAISDQLPSEAVARTPPVPTVQQTRIQSSTSSHTCKHEHSPSTSMMTMSTSMTEVLRGETDNHSHDIHSMCDASMSQAIEMRTKHLMSATQPGANNDAVKEAAPIVAAMARNATSFSSTKATAVTETSGKIKMYSVPAVFARLHSSNTMSSSSAAAAARLVRSQTTPSRTARTVLGTATSSAAATSAWFGRRERNKAQTTSGAARLQRTPTHTHNYSATASSSVLRSHSHSNPATHSHSRSYPISYPSHINHSSYSSYHGHNSGLPAAHNARAAVKPRHVLHSMPSRPKESVVLARTTAVCAPHTRQTFTRMRSATVATGTTNFRCGVMRSNTTHTATQSAATARVYNQNHNNTNHNVISRHALMSAHTPYTTAKVHSPQQPMAQFARSHTAGPATRTPFHYSAPSPLFRLRTAHVNAATTAGARVHSVTTTASRTYHRSRSSPVHGIRTALTTSSAVAALRTPTRVWTATKEHTGLTTPLRRVFSHTNTPNRLESTSKLAGEKSLAAATAINVPAAATQGATVSAAMMGKTRDGLLFARTGSAGNIMGAKHAATARHAKAVTTSSSCSLLSPYRRAHTPASAHPFVRDTPSMPSLTPRRLVHDQQQQQQQQQEQRTERQPKDKQLRQPRLRVSPPSMRALTRTNTNSAMTAAVRTRSATRSAVAAAAAAHHHTVTTAITNNSNNANTASLSLSSAHIARIPEAERRAVQIHVTRTRGALLRTSTPHRDKVATSFGHTRPVTHAPSTALLASWSAAATANTNTATLTASKTLSQEDRLSHCRTSSPRRNSWGSSASGTRPLLHTARGRHNMTSTTSTSTRTASLSTTTTTMTATMPTGAGVAAAAVDVTISTHPMVAAPSHSKSRSERRWHVMEGVTECDNVSAASTRVDMCELGALDGVMTATPAVPALALVHITASHTRHATPLSAQETVTPSVRSSLRKALFATPRQSHEMRPSSAAATGCVKVREPSHRDSGSDVGVGGTKAIRSKAAMRKSPLRRLSGAMSSLVHHFVRSDNSNGA